MSRRIILIWALMAGWLVAGAQDQREGKNFQPFPHDRAAELTSLKNLPLRADNSLQPYFPPVIDQLGWSCNQASSIGYLLSYELNRKRGLDGEQPENQMSPAFGYNILTAESPTTGVSYFDTWEIIKGHGCANVMDFPYTTNFQVWMNGYDKYERAILNKVVQNYSMDVSTAAGLRVLKGYLFNHFDAYPFGGLANLQIASNGMRLNVLPEDSYDAGSAVITSFGVVVGHALTVVGYNDEVQFDFNHDGLYTNNMDLDGDGEVTMADWEVGALIVVNSWGKGWGDRGKAYLPYRLLTRYGYEGGIWNRSVHLIDVVHDYEPQLLARVEIQHSHRSMVKISAGVSADPEADQPEFIQEFPIFNYHGGEGSLGSVGEGNHMEITLDISSLLSYIPADETVRFFLLVNEKDPAGVGSGELFRFEVIHQTQEGESRSVNEATLSIGDNQTTLATVNKQLRFDKLAVADYATWYTDANQWLSIPLQATGSSGGNQWEIVPDYKQDSAMREFPEVLGDFMPFYTGQEGFLELDLPFDFPFYGEFYRRLYADETGHLYLDTDFIDYPYSVDQDLVFRQRKAIVPFGANLFFSAQGGGIYYLATDTLVRILYDGQAPLGDRVRSWQFACNLYPDGKIEFHYGDLEPDQAVRATYRSGLSRGDGSQTLMTTPSRLNFVVPRQVVQLIPYRIPPKTKIESNSYILTRPEEVNQLFEIRVRVTDNQAKQAFGVIPVSTLDLSDPDIRAEAYPNPFSEQITVRFIQPEEGQAQVRIFNLHGQLIRTLFDGELDKGQHAMVWNGRSDSGRLVHQGLFMVQVVNPSGELQIKIVKIPL